jgi:hypothetical protein
MHRFLWSCVVVTLALVATAGSAADPAAERAAWENFDTAVRSRLAEARVRHEALRRALASAAYEEMLRRKQEESARDKAAALALARLAIPAELSGYAQELERMRRQAVESLEARSDGDHRLAAARERASLVYADGVRARLGRVK